MQKHLFSHARGQSGVDQSRDWHVRGQARIGPQMVDSGAQNLNKPQVGKSLEHAGRILPNDRRNDIRGVGVFRTGSDRERRKRRLQLGGPTWMAGIAIEQNRPSWSARAHGLLGCITQMLFIVYQQSDQAPTRRAPFRSPIGPRPS